MIFAFLLGVFDKQHLVDQAHKAVGDAAVLLVFGLCGEVVGNLALCVEFGKQAVASVADGRHEGTADFGCVWTEEVFEEFVHYVWRCLQVDINPEVVVVAQFVHGVGERGIEYAEKAVYGGGRIGLHVDAAVVATFPGNEFSAGGIEHHEFELRSHRSFAHRHVDFPHRIFGAIHTACPAGIPQAKTFGGAAEGENLAWCEHRSRHAQCNLSRSGHIWLFGTLVPADAFGECRRIERLVEGLVLPAVEDIVEAGAGRRSECVRMAPFALGLAIFVANDISVAERSGGVG